MESDLERGNGNGIGGGARWSTGDRARAGRRRRAQSRGQGWMTMLTLHAVFLAANGLLYMVIQIKYQNQKNSPFETQPVVMTISVVAFCVYLCATVLQAMLVQTNNKLGDTNLLLYIIGCSGILSLLSNALLLLFTHKVSCIVLAIIAFAASIRLVCVLFVNISNYISDPSKRLHDLPPAMSLYMVDLKAKLLHDPPQDQSFILLNFIYYGRPKKTAHIRKDSANLHRLLCT